jgi:hypothetical protein
MLFGHLAVSALLHRYLKADLTTAMVAGTLPDVVDKTLHRVLRLTPAGRMCGHTLLGMGLTTAAAGLIGGRRAAWSWALGYLGHLVSDSGDAGVPWLYPFVPRDLSRSEPDLWKLIRRALTDRKRMAVELTLTVWAVCALMAQRESSLPSDRAPSLPDKH